MATPEIPPSIQKFISEHIDSVEQLEVLLLLRAIHVPGLDLDSPAAIAASTLDATAISAELRSSPESVSRRLESLVAHGMLKRVCAEPPIRYRFAPGDEALAALVEQLAEIYRERRITVIQMIFSRPQGAFDALRSFSNAFKIKGDPTK